VSLSEHLTSCGAWTGHSCTCWQFRHPDTVVVEDLQAVRIVELGEQIYAYSEGLEEQKERIAKLEADERMSELVLGGQRKTIAKLEAELATTQAMLRWVWDTSIGVAGVEEVEGKFALWLAETRNCLKDGMGTL